MVTIPVVLVHDFYFYMHYPRKLCLFGNIIFELVYLSHIVDSHKITCILLRQVISLRKMVVLSVKFTILISSSPICIPLILLSALMRLSITSATIFYNSLDSRHPWRTNIRNKGSDRRPLILILDSILVYATLIMWINLSPYRNLYKVNSKDITKIFLFS